MSYNFGKDDLLAAMRDDHAHRYAGVTDGLISLDDMIADYQNADPSPTGYVSRKWDDSLPTIRRSFENWDWNPIDAKLRAHNVLMKVANVNNNWRSDQVDEDYCSYGKDKSGLRVNVNPAASRCYAIINSAIRNDSFVLAGGKIQYAIKDSYYNHNAWKNDFDLFICGTCEKKAETDIEKMFVDLKAESDDFRMFVNENCVTLVSSELKITIQIILRLYSSVSEIIHGFDVGASQVAWDGENVWFTALGRVAYEQGINVVTLSKRRTTYERRLVKYTQRGFGLVFPNLRMPNADEIETIIGFAETVSENTWRHVPRGKYRLDLPKLDIRFDSYSHEQLIYNREVYEGTKTASDIQRAPSKAKFLTPELIMERGYLELPHVFEGVNGIGSGKKSDYGGIEYYNAQHIDTVNFQNLANPDHGFYFYESKTGIINDSVFACSRDSVQNDLFSRINQFSRSRRGLTVDHLKKMLPSLEEWQGDYMDDLQIIAGLVKFTVSADNPRKDIIKQKKMAAKRIVQSVVDRVFVQHETAGPPVMKLKWKSVDDGTTLINPFGMKLVPEEDWYGTWYVEVENRISEKEMYGEIVTTTPGGQDGEQVTDEQLDELVKRVFEKIKPMIDEYIAKKK